VQIAAVLLAQEAELREHGVAFDHGPARQERVGGVEHVVGHEVEVLILKRVHPLVHDDVVADLAHQRNALGLGLRGAHPVRARAGEARPQSQRGIEVAQAAAGAGVAAQVRVADGAGASAASAARCSRDSSTTATVSRSASSRACSAADACHDSPSSPHAASKPIAGHHAPCRRSARTRSHSS
jgi:hypothetical protein